MNVVSYAQMLFKKLIFQAGPANVNAQSERHMCIGWSSLQFLWELELLMAAPVMQ